jgi:hypothetical protein
MSPSPEHGLHATKRPQAPIADPRARWLVVLLLAVLFALEVASMQRLTVTYDEWAHLRYGQNILNLDSTRFDDSKMPFSALNALPG